MQRRVADGVVTPYPKTERSRRRVPLTAVFDLFESPLPKLSAFVTPDAVPLLHSIP